MPQVRHGSLGSRGHTPGTGGQLASWSLGPPRGAPASIFTRSRALVHYQPVPHHVPLQRAVDLFLSGLLGCSKHELIPSAACILSAKSSNPSSKHSINIHMGGHFCPLVQDDPCSRSYSPLGVGGNQRLWPELGSNSYTHRGGIVKDACGGFSFLLICWGVCFGALFVD